MSIPSMSIMSGVFANSRSLTIATLAITCGLITGTVSAQHMTPLDSPQTVATAPAALPPRLAPAPSRKGTVERITVHGASLEGNLSGESATRDVIVYLPPSYQVERNRRYPVVYLLHGYGGSHESWTGELASVPELADHAIGSGAAREMILVMPNGNSKYLGSLYSNSVTTGDWERFLARDLVAYVDINYRTIPNRLSRGIGGHSMGGYGALRVVMKYPQVFSSVYAMSTCCLTANLSIRPEALAAAEAVRTPEDVAKADRGALGILARAAAWSPNPKNPPFYFDLPAKDGHVRPEIIAKWAANAPLAMLDQYVPNLKRLRALAFDMGNQDEAVRPETAKAFDAALTQFDIPHTFETYEGLHSNRIGERLETRVLPFFSMNLSFTQGRMESVERR